MKKDEVIGGLRVCPPGVSEGDPLEPGATKRDLVLDADGRVIALKWVNVTTSDTEGSG